MRGMHLLLAAVALTTAGCGERGAVGGGPELPEVGFENAAGPAIASRDATLPANCFVNDHAGSLAVFTRLTGADHPAEALGLLDLDSGRSREFLKAPRWSVGRANVLNAKVSEGWVAWEEVTSDESRWRIYAAPIDRAGLTVGEPIVVDEARATERPRAYLAVWRNAVFWTTRAADGGADTVIMEMRLPSGEKAEVWRTPGSVNAVRVRDGHALVTLVRAEKRKMNAVTVDLASRQAVTPFSLEASGPPSHFLDREGQTLAWASFDDPERPWPVIRVRVGNGETRVACLSGCDPAVRRGLVVFETAPIDGDGDLHGLSAVDVKAGTLFTLTTPASYREGVWQLVLAPSEPKGLAVAFRDQSAYAEPGSEPVTQVRTWVVP